MLSRSASGWGRISPTAHYTGHVWARHGLGEAAFTSPAGRLSYAITELVQAPVAALGGPRLQHFLLARHRIIDDLLAGAIEDGRVAQVVELAAGMSPRGTSFVRAHPRLSYVEADLPAMAARKQAALRRVGTDRARHQVTGIDVFSSGLEQLFATLEDTTGVAVVTEGLVNYLSTAQLQQLWSRVARQLSRFPFGLYLSDLHLQPRSRRTDRAFAAILGRAVRGRVHFHFPDEAAARESLERAGFVAARLHAPSEYVGVLPGMDAAGADRVRVVAATVFRHAGREADDGTGPE